LFWLAFGGYEGRGKGNIHHLTDQIGTPQNQNQEACTSCIDHSRRLHCTSTDNTMSKCSQATLTGLPLELRQAILSHADSTRTLRAAAVAGRCFHEAVQGSGGSIVVSQVLSRVLPLSLLPEAFAVFKSSQNQDLMGEARIRFVDDYFRSLHDCISHRLTLSEAASLESFHELVSELATDFAFRALSRHPRTGVVVDQAEVAPMSAQEVQRIQRAFYRFQLYCNLFHAPAQVKAHRATFVRVSSAGQAARSQWRRDVLSNQCDMFLSRFAVWESEQLASVYDFLYHEISERTSSISIQIPPRLGPP
jgi:hypothetical protein